MTDGVLFYSMWSGYREKAEMAEFLNTCREFGLREETLHTSGHAGHGDIEKLIKRVKPDEIIPVHTLCPEWFKERARLRAARNHKAKPTAPLGVAREEMQSANHSGPLQGLLA